MSSKTAAKTQYTSIILATVCLLALHRLSIRWNQTGQKHAGAPDISRSFFPHHHLVLWLLVIATYIHFAVKIVRQTLTGIMPVEISSILSLSAVLAAFVFKLNFAQADAPELVRGLGAALREWSSPLDLVLQARFAFGTIGALVVIVGAHGMMVGRLRGESGRQGMCFRWVYGHCYWMLMCVCVTVADEPRLLERLHVLLGLFLITQTRVNNVPLFLIFDLQFIFFQGLLFTDEDDLGDTFKGPARTARRNEVVTKITTTTLLLSFASFFLSGGTNAISSIDLSSAYNGISGYDVGAVGVLLFAGNWAGAIWWSTTGVVLLSKKGNKISSHVSSSGTTIADQGREWIQRERALLREQARSQNAIAAGATKSEEEKMASQGGWTQYVALLTLFVGAALLAVMVACTALRTHLFIWTVFSPKFLYAMAWSLGWHLGVNVLVGGVFCGLGAW